MAPANLILRADASESMGMGHVMRCIALAQAWEEAGGRAHWAMSDPAGSIAQVLAQYGWKADKITAAAGTMADAGELAAIAVAREAQWMAVDGYQFGAGYQRALKDAGLRVLLVDDCGTAHPYCADLVLNQNLHAREALYAERSPATRLLLGPRYALLRREFVPPAQPGTAAGSGRRVLVTMGGSDPRDLTTRVLRALERSQPHGLVCDVVVGGGNPRAQQLRLLADGSQCRISLHVSPRNLPQLMANADLAIAAAGSTCWELCRLGVPMILVAAAENQRAVAESLEQAGAALFLRGENPCDGPGLAESLAGLLGAEQRRAEMSRRGRTLVDGLGARRVVTEMMAGELRLRTALPEDARLFWTWANDPDVRAVSFASDPIPWEDHERWFRSKIADPRALLLVAEAGNGQPIGQVRYELNGTSAVLSISLAKEHRGRGLGLGMLRAANRRLHRERAGVETVHAYVKPGNRASLRLFESAGFERQAASEVRGQEAAHFTWGVQSSS